VSFAVDRAGRIAVADVVNGRIQVFAADGKHERSLPTASVVHDLVADDLGGLYALGTDGSLTAHDLETGRQGERWSIAPEMAKSLGRLRALDGALSLESPDQRSYQVFAAGKPLAARTQEGALRKGAPGRSGDYYSTSYRNQGHLFRLDGQGKVVFDVALNLPDVASVNFLGEDRSGALYVQVERFQAGDTVAVEVRRFDRSGSLTATIPVPAVTYLEMTRSLLVTDSGDVYGLLPSESGATVLRWRLS
jgi:hypothetical protein